MRFRQGRGQRVALVDLILYLGNDRAKGGIGCLFKETVQGLDQGDACPEQGGELAGGNVDLLLADTPSQRGQGKGDAGGFCGLGRCFTNIYRITALLSYFLASCRCPGISLDNSLFLFTGRIQGCIFIDWHGMYA